MTDQDLPEELADFPSRPVYADVLERALSGEMVAYHPEKALIAVWSGGTGFNVYDPDFWNIENRLGEVYHFNMPDHSQVENPREYARETLEDYGFEVVGQ